MRVFPGAQLLAVILVLCKLSVLVEGKAVISILNRIFVRCSARVKLELLRVRTRIDLITYNFQRQDVAMDVSVLSLF